MMTTANGEQHHVLISEDGGQLLANAAGHVMLQQGQETFVIQAAAGSGGHIVAGHLGKVEPEDLSFGSSNGGGGGLVGGGGHDDDVIRAHAHIDLEAGAQAIQASAATAVQNVLRSLKESDKSILNQILPAHLLADVMTSSSSSSAVRQPHHSGGSVVVTANGGGPVGGGGHISVLDESLIGRPDSAAAGLDDFAAEASGGALSGYSTSSGGSNSNHRRSRGSQESATSSQQQQAGLSKCLINILVPVHSRVKKRFCGEYGGKSTVRYIPVNLGRGKWGDCRESEFCFSTMSQDGEKYRTLPVPVSSQMFLFVCFSQGSTLTTVNILLFFRYRYSKKRGRIVIRKSNEHQISF
jgi:hypothetical protein